ncbi:ribonuclease HIII, partial [Candidatus Poribacteria bacterium]|nr:ribonuclease HIII [Candidatus Poribacteria bacterium]
YNMKKLHHWNAWIGTDESGKGDYFGPLVVAGVYINNDCIDTFVEMGISDGKKITNSRVEKLANWMWEHYEENIVVIKKMPETYNTDYDHFQSQGKNLNTLLASMHVEVIQKLSESKGTEHVLVDKFSYHDIVTSQLRSENMDVKLETKAERDIAVAAASIIARATFLTDMDALSKEFDFELPRGATPNVKVAARDFIRQHGVSALGNVAKLHFKTTKDVLY